MLFWHFHVEMTLEVLEYENDIFHQHSLADFMLLVVLYFIIVSIKWSLFVVFDLFCIEFQCVCCTFV